MKDLINDVFISMHASSLVKENVCTRRGINISAMLITYIEKARGVVVIVVAAVVPLNVPNVIYLCTRDRPYSGNQTKASRI